VSMGQFLHITRFDSEAAVSTISLFDICHKSKQLASAFLKVSILCQACNGALTAYKDNDKALQCFSRDKI